MKEVKKIADNHGIPLIEDTAWGCGGYYDEIPLGTYGDIGTYSFDFAKTMDLPIRQVVRSQGISENNITDLLEAYVGDGVLINSQAFDGLPVQEAKKT